MRELALHLLDIAQNSVAAGATTIQVSVLEDTIQDRLQMIVQDDGKGMTPEIMGQVTDPFFTSRTTRKVGLGLPLLKEAAESCQGSLKLQSEPSQGTLVSVDFQRSHIDRMPLGDLSGTFLTMLVSAPQIRWIFRYALNGEEFYLDSQPIMDTLGGVSITEPSILTFIRETISQGLTAAQKAELQPAKNIIEELIT